MSTWSLSEKTAVSCSLAAFNSDFFLQIANNNARRVGVHESQAFECSTIG